MRKKKGDQGRAKNTFKEVPCIIGIDQSYTRTGIAICTKGTVRKVTSIRFKQIRTKTGKRWLLRDTLRKIIESCLKHYTPEQIVIIAERVRTFTRSDINDVQFIKASSAMMAYIVDTGLEYGIKTYSVDTRAWKSKVLGDSRPVFEPIRGVENPQKFGSVRKAIELGFEEELTILKHNSVFHSYNDDMADAICISLYPFSGGPYKLKLEQ